MNIEIIKSLNHLLYEQEFITVPSFGSFEIKQLSAVIDPVSGKIHPPIGRASFSPTIQSENQQLKLALVNHFGYDEKQAAVAITQFVRGIKTKLEQKEIVYLDGIGKLFLDHEDNISFLPTTENHTRSNYALPDVEYTPVPHGERAPKHAPRKVKKKKKEKLNKKTSFTPMATGGAFVLIAFVVFFSVKQYIKSNPVPEVAQVIHVNEKPSSILPTPVPFMDEIANIDTEEKPTTQTRKAQPAIEVEDELSVQETKARTLNNNECVIIAGNFTSRKNARKMIKDLVEKGYAPFNDKKGRRYRVGVIFQYDSVYEIKNKLESLSDEYDTSAWILRK